MTYLKNKINAKIQNNTFVYKQQLLKIILELRKVIIGTYPSIEIKDITAIPPTLVCRMLRMTPDICYGIITFFLKNT